MTKLTLTLWIVGVALQIILLVALVSRSIVRRFPIVGVLMGFYILRSAAFYNLARHIARPAGELMLSILALTHVVLQIAVAWELFSSLEWSALEPRSFAAPLLDGSLFNRIAAFSMLLLAATGLTVLCTTYIHGSQRAPIDRSVVLTSILFLLIFLASRATRIMALAGRLLTGLAVYSAVGILCQIERTLAAVQRNATRFNHWSYAQPVAYLMLVLFWIVFLPSSRQDTPVLGERQPKTARKQANPSRPEDPMPLAR